MVTRSHKAALILIICAVCFDLAFDLVPGNGPRRSWFAWTGHDFTPPVYNEQTGELEWDGKLYLATVLYYGFGHLSLICYFISAYLMPTRRMFLLLAGFEIADLVEYAITYNSTYVSLDQVIPPIVIPIEFGLFKSLGVILFTIREFYGISGRLR